MVELTDGERLIAVMLADLMDHLKVDSELDVSFVKRAITGNDEWALAWKYPGLFSEEGPPSDEVVQETARIMTMYRIIEDSLGELGAEDRAEVEKHPWARFTGFDGNHEPHFGVARVLVEDLDRFEEFKGRGLNSHHATLDHYRNMRERFDRVRGGRHQLLGRDELLEILG